MTHRILAALFVLAVSARADVVSLVNGDRVTGTLVKKDGDSLTVKTALMGDVTIKWKDVANVATEAPVTVVLAPDRSVQGRVATEGDSLVVRTTPETRAVLTEVQTIRNADEQRRYERFLNPPLTDLWAGYADFAVATAQGNAETLVLTTAVNATRLTSSDKTVAYFNQIYSRGLLNGVTVPTARAIRGGWAYNHNVARRTFWNVFNDYEFDRFQNLDLRVVLGSGLGYNLIRSERGQLDLLGGASWNREKFTVPLATPLPGGEPSDEFVRNSAEAYWGNDLTWKLRGASSLRQAFRMFNNLSNGGEYRMNFDIGLDTRLIRFLSWQVTVSDRFLSNPAPGRERNDILVSSGVRFSFSRMP